MQVLLLIAKTRTNLYLREKTYIIGYRQKTKEIVLESELTSRTIYFENLTDANLYLAHAMQYLPRSFNYNVTIINYATLIEPKWKLWTTPVVTVDISKIPDYILTLAHKRRKEKE